MYLGSVQDITQRTHTAPKQVGSVYLVCTLLHNSEVNLVNLWTIREFALPVCGVKF